MEVCILGNIWQLVRRINLLLVRSSWKNRMDRKVVQNKTWKSIDLPRKVSEVWRLVCLFVFPPRYRWYNSRWCRIYAMPILGFCHSYAFRKISTLCYLDVSKRTVYLRRTAFYYDFFNGIISISHKKSFILRKETNYRNRDETVIEVFRSFIVVDWCCRFGSLQLCVVAK